MQHRLLAVNHQGMAGVMSSLKPHDCGGVLGEQIDDLALALVAPLRANDDYILAHVGFLKCFCCNEHSVRLFG